MKMIVESSELDPYLAETEEIDFSHRSIKEKANELSVHSRDELAFVQAAFEYVRDRISHSWDIRSTRVTWRASDVLRYREGICYAKSNLLAALLRSEGVPAGFCYQKLTLGDTPDTGYVIHALNGVYLKSLNRWIRLDARGNKAGVDARFSVDAERLAFPIRLHYDEIDYPTICARPNAKTLSVLKQSVNNLDMYLNRLPSSL